MTSYAQPGTDTELEVQKHKTARRGTVSRVAGSETASLSRFFLPHTGLWGQDTLKDTPCTRRANAFGDVFRSDRQKHREHFREQGESQEWRYVEESRKGVV